jgi:hypothetical protein
MFGREIINAPLKNTTWQIKEEKLSDLARVWV